MPVKKISDAPANIRELDDVKLTLAQINKVLEIYDALKAQKKVKNPMAVAIGQFKKSYHVSGGKWVKNEEEATTATRASTTPATITFPCFRHISRKSGNCSPIDSP